MKYFLTIDGQTVGPLSIEQLMCYSLTDNTPVSRDGGPWQPLYTYPELKQALYNRNMEQCAANPGSASSPEVNNKKILCGIMALLLGTLGIQYFILGKVGAGFLTILLTIVTCGAWSLIVFIQGIMMLCMSDCEFERKYMDPTKTFPVF